MLEIYGNSCFYHVLLLCHLGRKYLFTYLLQIILQMQSYSFFFCFQNNISKQHLPKVPKLLIRQVSNNSALVFCKKLLAEENSCCCVSITRLVKSHLLLTYRGAFLWRNLGEICHFLTETFFWHAIGDFDKNIPVTLAQSREQLSTRLSIRSSTLSFHQ